MRTQARSLLSLRWTRRACTTHEAVQMADLQPIRLGDHDALANAVTVLEQPDDAEPQPGEPAGEPLAATGDSSTGVHLIPQDDAPPVDGNLAVEPGPYHSPYAPAAQPDPRRRNLLLFLLLSVLGSIAIWTPTGLQDATASALELLMDPDVQPVRTSAGRAPLVGQLDVNSAPSAELIVDGESRGVTPMQLVLNAGRHELLFVSQRGTVRRTVRIQPGRRTLYSEAIFPGALVVPRPDDAEVWIDGEAVDAGGELMLPPGSYEVRVVDEQSGSRTTHTVDILPGLTTVLDPDADHSN
jgi:hypothetical protein